MLSARDHDPFDDIRRLRRTVSRASLRLKMLAYLPTNRSRFPPEITEADDCDGDCHGEEGNRNDERADQQCAAYNDRTDLRNERTHIRSRGTAVTERISRVVFHAFSWT
jgi:hypothetical protein